MKPNENFLSHEETFIFGMHIISCAKIFAILGIFGSFLSITSAVFLWYYLPFALISALIFTYILIGIQFERPSLLFPAIIFLGINFILHFAAFITLVVITIVMPSNLVELYTNDDNVERGRSVTQIAYFVIAAYVLVSTIYNIVALKVILKARNFMIALSKIPPSTSSSTAF